MAKKDALSKRWRDGGRWLEQCSTFTWTSITNQSTACGCISTGRLLQRAGKQTDQERNLLAMKCHQCCYPGGKTGTDLLQKTAHIYENPGKIIGPRLPPEKWQICWNCVMIQRLETHDFWSPYWKWSPLITISSTFSSFCCFLSVLPHRSAVAAAVLPDFLSWLSGLILWCNWTSPPHSDFL